MTMLYLYNIILHEPREKLTEDDLNVAIALCGHKFIQERITKEFEKDGL